MLIDKYTKVMVQGITGRQGGFHTNLMLDYGTKIVCGVTPGKGGERVHDIPVYDNVSDALQDHKVDWSVLFVPAPFVKTAAVESLQNNLNIVIISEGVPVHDSLEIMKLANKKKLYVIGPNCPGIINVSESKIGIMPNHIFKKGSVGIVSRSGTLTYEIIHELSTRGIGQSTAIGIGGDPVIGIDFIQALKLFKEDGETKKVILIGEIGGSLEERTAAYLKKGFDKPVYSFIAGRTAPPGRRMGHAGAIISGNSGTAGSKIKALEAAGVKVCRTFSELANFIIQKE